MRSAFTAVLLFLIPFGSASQDSPLKPDGRMWDAWSNSGSESLHVKAAYVQGVIEGIEAGTTFGYYRGRFDEVDAYVDKGPCASIPPTKLTKPSSNTTVDELKVGADKARAEAMPEGVSVLQIVHQMDKFYSDYRNTPVCMITAVQESISSLHGTASSEQGLEMERKGCKP
jgi:hypothetical protein